MLNGGAKAVAIGLGQMLTTSEPLRASSLGDPPIGWTAASKDHMQPDRGDARAYVVALHEPEKEWEVRVSWATVDRTGHSRATATLPAGFTLVGGGAKENWARTGNLLVDSYSSGARSWIGAPRSTCSQTPAPLTSTQWAFAVGLETQPPCG